MVKKNIVIVGTGAVAAELTMYLNDIDDVQLKGYLEYESNLDKYYRSYNFEQPVLGDIDSYVPQENDYFLLGVSNINFRKIVLSKLKAKNGKFYTLIHPTALVAKDAVIGEGCTIAPFCIIGPHVKIGKYNLMTSYSAISHDCILGDNNVFSTSVICGHVNIGDDNIFYIRTTVQPNLNIGNRNVIAAGMLVDSNIDDDSTIFYKYKEKIIAIPKVH